MSQVLFLVCWSWSGSYWNLLHFHCSYESLWESVEARVLSLPLKICCQDSKPEGEDWPWLLGPWQWNFGDSTFCVTGIARQWVCYLHLHLQIKDKGKLRGGGGGGSEVVTLQGRWWGSGTVPDQERRAETTFRWTWGVSQSVFISGSILWLGSILWKIKLIPLTIFGGISLLVLFIWSLQSLQVCRAAHPS